MSLPADDPPGSEGEWVVDSNAQGGWRWAPEAEALQTLQVDDAVEDPYAWAYVAAEPSDNNNPYSQMHGDDFFPSDVDSDDEPPEVYHTPDAYYMDMAMG